ncbi:MAG: GT4 family glycosyltransferase PelF [Polyangiales bacterium]
MKPVADVALLLEGTYPFVRGGVSSWVHQIVTGLPERTFSLIFVGGRRKDYGELRYELPKNVLHLEKHYLEDAWKETKPGRSRARPAAFEESAALHQFLKQLASRKTSSLLGELPALAERADKLLDALEQPHGLGIDDYLSHPLAWEHIRKAHLEGDPNASFVDYFWSLRLMHGPLFQLARIANGAPQARAFHTISTGYAGFLGSLLARRQGRPLILSEHGIYTKERRIDLNQAEWFDELYAGREAASPAGANALRELWIRFFESLGRLTYRVADPIISLYEGNRTRQLQDGAEQRRTRVIVNGIDSARFQGALAARSGETPPVVGLLGRVVPIKDVKTFIRTMHQVISVLPKVEGWVIGGADEDPRYAEECEALARSLGIADKLRFLGHQNVLDVLPKLGVLMLTSISEAQPLAILEAFAAGVPCIATDVGACREQIEGNTPDDRALGHAGRVVPFADAAALAQAAIELLSKPDKWHDCQVAGRNRVEQHYSQRAMLDAYDQVYRSALEA